MESKGSGNRSKKRRSRSPKHKHRHRDRESSSSSKHHNKHKHRRYDDDSSEDDRKKYSKHRKRDRSPLPNKYYKFNEAEMQKMSQLSDNYETMIKQDSEEEKEFSFEKYKYEFNLIFFRDEDIIKYGSEEYHDFWKFLKKYIDMQQKTGKKNISSDNCVLNEALGIPVEFAKRHLVSIKLDADIDQLMSRIPPRDRDTGRWLPKKRVSEFQDILMLYLDFKQKEKFKKFKKLRESQGNLPVAHYRDEIVKAVNENQVVVIAGDTGCGKSTQVPQYLIKSGFTNIACTQPRRIACISLSKRVAYETLNQFGTEVGYQIRFEKNKTQHTKILFITEGLLLRQVSLDPSLSTYEVIVLDEVHERHLHGDFLLGILRCLLLQRPTLKLVLMSATINIELFAGFFASHNPCVIQVPGRLYPIKLHYRPIVRDQFAKKNERLNPGPFVQILQLIDEKYPKDEKGDVLMFLSGMAEISTVVEAAKMYAQQSQNWIILSLHSSLSLAEQDKVFDYPPEGVRKCIVSTNIAETSVTIDGIRFVVDSGKVKEMSYDSTCKMQKLKEFWVSQASAEQRKGRAGRTGPGVCFRLFSEEEYEAMTQYTTPEILRVPLDSLLLQMVAMGLPDARCFPFIEAPPAESIELAITSLKEQGALTEEEKLTPMGRMLSCLPVDVGIGKMLVLGSMFHQVEPVLSLAAALSVQSPFTNRAYRDPECETARKQLESDHGDPITLLNALKEWLEVKQDKDARPGQSTRWCRRRGLEEQRFYEMTKLRRQFKQLLRDSKLLYSAEEERKLTSAERTQRHGELRLLRQMRKEHRQAEPRRRTTLRLDPWGLQEGEGMTEEPEEDGKVDIKDVEFRLGNDSAQLKSLLSGSTATSYKDLMMLKVIACSGLYPQLAIADEFNHSKSAPEQMFHTRNKPFTVLHPMSYFANHSSELHLQESDLVYPPKFPKRQAKHQLLAYLSLLETTKPYLMNTMRMPAAQTLLLLARSIDTNAYFTRVVCDGWLQMMFPTAEAAEVLILKTAQLRDKWEQLITLKLQDTQLEEGEEGSGCGAAKLECEVFFDIVKFLQTEVVYSLQRLLAADMKIMYVGESANVITVDPNPLQSSYPCSPHPSKGGIRLTPNITYNCLAEVEDTSWLESDPWRCPQCDMLLCVLPIERMSHSTLCKTTHQIEEEKKDEAVTSEESNTSSRYPAYECPDCGTVLHLPPTEVLRHRRQHLAQHQDPPHST